MGKPIAGQNQFPYTIGGLMVDGAKINNETFVKQLFIYKQRSMNYYDLIDFNGKVYRNIKIGHTDINGNVLNYFELLQNTVQEIPNNTFFMKIQDPSRNLFSFVRVYQWHKCIAVNGESVFRTPAIHPELSGVFIEPSSNTIVAGELANFTSNFFPNQYSNKKGTWVLNSVQDVLNIGIVPASARSSSIVYQDKDTVVIKGDVPGISVLSFIPDDNTALISNAIVHVVEQDDEQLKSVFPIVKNKTDYLMIGDEFDVTIATYPPNTPLPQALQVEDVSSSSLNWPVKATLKSVSDDFKTYTFVVEKGNAAFTSIAYSILLNFSMTEPYDYSFSCNTPYITQDLNSRLKPKVSLSLPMYMNLNSSQRVYGTYQYSISDYNLTSSDPTIADFDIETNTIKTFDKEGAVVFSSTYKKMNDDTEYVYEYPALNVTKDCYDYVEYTPDINIVARGTEQQFYANGIRSDGTKVPLKFDPYLYDYDDIYTITEDGLLKTNNTYKPNKPFQISLMFEQTHELYDRITKYANSKTLYSTNISLPEPTEIITTMNVQTSLPYLYIEYDKAGVLGDYTFYSTFNVPSNPNDRLKIVSYDSSIIELIDNDFYSDIVQDSQLLLVTKFRPLKPGVTELVIGSVDNPSMISTVYIIIYEVDGK